jgi:hypothetical protein
VLPVASGLAVNSLVAAAAGWMEANGLAARSTGLPTPPDAVAVVKVFEASGVEAAVVGAVTAVPPPP